MGYRINTVYTRSGDQGQTSTANGNRVSKSCSRIALQGDIDELNSWLGLLRQSRLPEGFDAILNHIQHTLFEAGAEVSSSHPCLEMTDIQWLEQHIDRINAQLPILREFVLPGGNQDAAICHLTRSCCRRTERTAVHVNQEESLSPVLLGYLNRLSDLLFVMARTLARQDGQSEVLWSPRHVESD
ncbi:MAG: cob(I)yrinic acid a,c-diamide adenosyltransferase [Gammaproteobacteria bacterium]|nr:MAG: cob(I)yrinic acid a,c-diamide adenosyltransferase [Gammaproteobacteria bacterium]